MPNEYLDTILMILKEAGTLSLHFRENSSPDFKPDMSIITKADTEISKLATRHLTGLLQRPGHILIDEEDQQSGRYLDPNVLSQSTHIFSIDPIDGTRAYANRWPHYGISLGVIKNLRPWIGAVYFPVLDELFYCDGTCSYFVQNAYTAGEIKRPIIPIDLEINKLTLFLLTDSYFQKFSWDFKECHIMIPACAVVDLCWPTIGRACGSIMKSYVWDFAGAWPILASAGLGLRTLSAGQLLDRLDANLFDQGKTPWRLKEPYILSSERNFSILKNKIKF